MRAPRPGDLTSSTPRPARLPIQTASIFLRSDVGESLLATQLVICLYLSNTASLDLPLDAGASSPARQPYLSNLLLNEALPVRHGDSKTSRTSARASGTNSLTFSNLLLDQAYPSDTAILKPVGRRRESPGQTTFLFLLRLARPTQPRCRLTVRPSNPLNFALLSKPFRLGEPRSPDGRRREHSRSDNLIFSSPRATRLTRPTRQFRNPSRTSARASQPDNLTISSPKLGEAYPVRHGDC